MDEWYRLSFDELDEGAAFIAALSRYLASPAVMPLSAQGSSIEVAALWKSGSPRVDVYLSRAALDATTAGFGRPQQLVACAAGDLPSTCMSLLTERDRRAYGKDEIVRRITRVIEERDC